MAPSDCSGGACYFDGFSGRAGKNYLPQRCFGAMESISECGALFRNEQTGHIYMLQFKQFHFGANAPSIARQTAV